MSDELYTVLLVIAAILLGSGIGKINDYFLTDERLPKKTPWL